MKLFRGHCPGLLQCDKCPLSEFPRRCITASVRVIKASSKKTGSSSSSRIAATTAPVWRKMVPFSWQRVRHCHGRSSGSASEGWTISARGSWQTSSSRWRSTHSRVSMSPTQGWCCTLPARRSLRRRRYAEPLSAGPFRARERQTTPDATLSVGLSVCAAAMVNETLRAAMRRWCGEGIPRDGKQVRRFAGVTLPTRHGGNATGCGSTSRRRFNDCHNLTTIGCTISPFADLKAATERC
jgi:hypothetical protein